MERNSAETLPYFLIDTNIFLELLLNQEKAADVIKFFSLIEKGVYVGFYTIFTLHSLLIILTTQKKWKSLLNFLTYLASYPTFQLLTASSPSEEKQIVKICKTQLLDFDDATQYYFTKKINAALVSFDKHFDKTDLKRKKPKEILEKLIR